MTTGLMKWRAFPSTCISHSCCVRTVVMGFEALCLRSCPALVYLHHFMVCHKSLLWVTGLKYGTFLLMHPAETLAPSAANTTYIYTETQLSDISGTALCWLHLHNKTFYSQEVNNTWIIKIKMTFQTQLSIANVSVPTYF